MTQDIPALIAEARQFVDRRGVRRDTMLIEDKGCWTPDLVDVLTVLDETPNRPIRPEGES